MKPQLKAPGTMRLTLEHGEPPSNFAFQFNLRRYFMDSAPGELEPGMVSKSFQAVLGGEPAPAPGGGGAGGSGGWLRQVAAALLVWPPVADRLQAIDTAWGGYPV